MRRLSLLILAVVLVATTAAFAATRSEHKFSMTFSKKTPGVATGISFVTDRFAYQPPAVGQPADRVAKTVFVMQPGTRTDTRAVPTCSLATIEGDLGADGCPAGSKIGSGKAVALTGIAALDPATFDVTVYAAKNGLLAYLKGLSLTTIPLTMRANKITAEVPRTCNPGGSLADGCSNGEVVLQRLSVKIDRRSRGGRALIRTPRTCPRSGTWTNTATYAYANGDTETQTVKSPCRK